MNIIEMIYTAVCNHVAECNIKNLPVGIDVFSNSNIFTSSENIEISKDPENIFMDADFYYTNIFYYLEQISQTMMYISDSQELMEDETVGDYIYYCGFINPEVPYMFSSSTHPSHVPNRITIFGTVYQIEISADSPMIEVYEIPIRNRAVFLIYD